MSDTIINTSINIFVLVFQLLYFFVADTDIQLGHFFQKLFSTFSNSKMAGVRFFFRALFPWAYCSRLSSRFSSGCHNPSALYSLLVKFACFGRAEVVQCVVNGRIIYYQGEVFLLFSGFFGIHYGCQALLAGSYFLFIFPSGTDRAQAGCIYDDLFVCTFIIVYFFEEFGTNT